MTRVASLVLAAGVALLASVALAADPPKDAVQDPSPAQRAKMAEAHHRMADCLKSERSIAECRAEMQNSCGEVMGESGCGMGGGRMHGPGMHGPGMMGGKPARE